MSCSHRSTARSCCLGKSGGTWALYFTSLPGARNARRKECKIEEGHLMPDHVHILISIPPKYSVAEVIEYLKGKSSIWIAQNVERKLRNFLGHKFWARGYFVSTVGRDEETIRSRWKAPQSKWLRTAQTRSARGCRTAISRRGGGRHSPAWPRLITGLPKRAPSLLPL
jgi:putative transposase